MSDKMYQCYFCGRWIKPSFLILEIPAYTNYAQHVRPAVEKEVQKAKDNLTKAYKT